MEIPYGETDDFQISCSYLGGLEFVHISNSKGTPQKFNSSPLKNDAWKTILSFWGPVYFQGLCLLNFQGVSI